MLNELINNLHEGKAISSSLKTLSHVIMTFPTKENEKESDTFT